MKIVLTLRAQRQLTAAARWWAFHRDKAPAAFEEDFGEVIDLIQNRPGVGHVVRAHRSGIRRVLMERVRYYVYYRLSAGEEVEVLSIWHASRRPPRL